MKKQNYFRAGLYALVGLGCLWAIGYLFLNEWSLSSYDLLKDTGGGSAYSGTRSTNMLKNIAVLINNHSQSGLLGTHLYVLFFSIILAFFGTILLIQARRSWKGI